MNQLKWGEDDVPPQSGRIVIITGGNSGLGFEAARVLSNRGAKVILACRNQGKGEAACSTIRAGNLGADVLFAPLDISDLQSVRRFARHILDAYPKFDLLINNAGIMATPYAKSKDNFEMQLATNHLGHFALTGLLLPRMKAVAGSRIVAVSSIAARSGQIDFKDLMGERTYDPWKAYNQSKLANLMFGIELQRRLARANAATVALIAHPGASRTNLFSTPGAALTKRVLAPLMRFLFQEAKQGVLPVLYAATSATIKPGAYYGPDRFNEMKGSPSPAKVPSAADDAAAARTLWEVSETLTGVHYP